MSSTLIEVKKTSGPNWAYGEYVASSRQWNNFSIHSKVVKGFGDTELEAITELLSNIELFEAGELNGSE